MDKEQKYEKAMAELQSIVTKMENDELDVDQLSEQLKRQTKKSRKSLLKNKFYAVFVVNMTQKLYFCKQNRNFNRLN